MSMIVSPGPVLVGLTFLWTAGMKSLSPNGFYIHLQKLGVIPERFIAASVTLAAAFEAAIGAALVVGAWPKIVLPSTIAVLVVLSLITWISVKSGRVTDCGCYGGFIVPSIHQSLLINSLLIVLLLSGFIINAHDGIPQAYAKPIVLLIGLLFGLFAWLSIRNLRTKGEPLVNLSPLKVGNRWKKQWTGGTVPPRSGELIVAYLGPDCPFCKQWVPVLNAMKKSEVLPQIVGVTGASTERLETFKSSAGIQFPLNPISQSLMNRLVLGVPTTVVITDGRISDIWSGQMSTKFMSRFKAAFFPEASNA